MIADVFEDETLRNEALRKIGRNLINLQKVEASLKVLVVHGNLNCSLTELKAVATQRTRRVSRQTFGLTLDEFLKVFSPQPRGRAIHKSNNPEHRHEFSFTLQLDEAELKARKTVLRQLVAERNKLVHTMLVDFDSKSAASCNELISRLDAQHERVIPQFEYVAGLVRFLCDSQLAVISALGGKKGTEGKKERKKGAGRTGPIIKGRRTRG